MQSIVFIITCALIAVSMRNLAMSVFLARRLRRVSPAILDDSKLPKTGVIISLRGSDGGLRNYLRGLLDQDYPRYQVEIVVDSESDPAWQAVQDVIRETGCTHANVQTLAFRRRACSLKCSALIQGVSALDASHEVIAFCDADVVPHRTWLRELVSPLLDRQVGATMGNRWFAGNRRLFGSQARAVWNAGALTQMTLFGIPWGGTLALRRETLDQTDVLARWSRSFNDDLVLGEAVRRLGLEMRLVPSLLMVEREEISLRACREFVYRQLMHVRFYVRSWPVVAGIAIVSAWLSLGAMILCLIGMAQLNSELILWSGGGFGVYLAGLAISYLMVESAVAATLRRFGRAIEPLGARVIWVAPLAVCLHTAALLPAMIRRTVSWRGVIYRISAAWDVEMLEDRPASRHSASQPALTRP